MKKTTDKKRVAIYIRVSSDEQKREGLSLEVQKRQLEDYAEMKDWYVYKVYGDFGVSAKSIKGRKAFQGMLQDAKESKFSAILITKFDRAFRNVKDGYMTLDELREIGVDFISLSENIDTTTAMGKAMFGIINVFAQLERELTGERVQSILNDKFHKGLLVGKAPIGYKYSKTKKMFIKDKNAWIIEDVFKMASRGENYKDICKKHNLGITTYYNILKNKAYLGFVEYNGQIMKGTHEPIIDEKTFNMVNR